MFSPVLYIKGIAVFIIQLSDTGGLDCFPKKQCEDKYVIDALFRARCMELEDDLVLTVGSFVNLKLSVKWVLQQHTR